MLKYKLFKWFAAVVLVFGVLAALLGIWVISERTVHEAQTRVRLDLGSAWSVYQSQLRAMETTIRLTALRPAIVDACVARKWQDRAVADEIQNLLATTCTDFDLDFMALVSPDGQVQMRSCPPYRTGDYRMAEPIVARALAGTRNSGTVLLSREDLAREADGLLDRAFLSLQETAHARPTPRGSEDRGMVMLAAAPLQKNGQIVGAVYAGVLLNRNEAMVDRIQNIVFGQEKYQGTAVGAVTLFLADTRIATTVLLDNGNRAIGTRVSREVADRVLDNGQCWVDRAFVVKDWYLTAYDPIRDSQGRVIGMVYVGALERPYQDLRKGLIYRYAALVAGAVVVTLLMAMFVAGRVAAPLHRLAESAKMMQHGHAFTPVSASHSCSETAGLIGAFNEMASTLLQREQELKQANDELGNANNALKALNTHYMETLQFVSHELNTPISSITNYAYMLRQRLLGDLTPKQENALEIINADVRRVMEMIRHYLNLARIETGEMQPVARRLVLREEVIAPILNSLQADIHQKNLRVEDLIDPHLVLHCDPNMIREVFENLLSNAVKYGRNGGVVSLKSRRTGQFAELSVRNDGDGIPPERRGDLFQKFSRLELGDAKKAKRGTGLGLFITKKIVELHGGTIAMDSEVGRWTEFRCTLPLEPEAPRPADSKSTANATSVPTDPDARPLERSTR